MPIVKYYTAQVCLAQGIAVISSTTTYVHILQFMTFNLEPQLSITYHYLLAEKILKRIKTGEYLNPILNSLEIC